MAVELHSNLLVRLVFSFERHDSSGGAVTREYSSTHVRTLWTEATSYDDASDRRWFELRRAPDEGHICCPLALCDWQHYDDDDIDHCRSVTGPSRRLTTGRRVCTRYIDGDWPNVQRRAAQFTTNSSSSSSSSWSWTVLCARLAGVQRWASSTRESLSSCPRNFSQSSLLESIVVITLELE